MIINSITIENFQCYYGIEKLEFSKGMNLIIGEGGKGKSKLFNAFYWALFGNIYITNIGWKNTNIFDDKSKNGIKKHEFINKKLLKESLPSDKLVVRVALEITHIDDSNRECPYTIERSIIVRRRNFGNWDDQEAWDIENSKLKVHYESTHGSESEEDINADAIISEIFPEGIRDYIWFQGESLDDLINFSDNNTLKKAVKHISYYPIYERLTKIISESTTAITQKKNRKSNAISKNLTARKTHTSLIEKNEGIIQQENKKLEGFKAQAIELDGILGTTRTKLSGLSEYPGLYAQELKITTEIESISNEIDSLDKYQRRQLQKTWILKGIDSMISNCKMKIKEFNYKNETPTDTKFLEQPSKSKLEAILHDEQCFVCQSKVDSGSDAYEAVLKRIKDQDDFFKELEECKNRLEEDKKMNYIVGKISDYPDEILRKTSIIDQQIDDSEEQISKLLSKRKRLREELNGVKAKVDELKKKYKVDFSVGVQQSQFLNSSIRHTEKELDKIKINITKIQRAILDLKSEIKVAQEQLNKLDKSEGMNLPEMEWEDISLFLEKVTRSVQEKARKELLEKIENRANIYYTQFTEHNSGYKGKVQIDDDYTIIADPSLNTSHEDRKKMSIINAMLSLNQEALGVSYPFISDAPTSSFDEKTTQAYILGVKDMFDQCIIITKDVTSESDYFKQLYQEDRITNIYKLTTNVCSANTINPEIYETHTLVTPLKRS